MQPEDQGSYRCIVFNDYGSDTSNSALLTVEIVPPAIIYGPPSVNEWEVATYSVTYQEGHIYDFSTENGNIIGTSENSVTVQWGPNGYGYVYLVETNEIGCIGDTVTLTVIIGNVGFAENDQNDIYIFPNPVRKIIYIKNLKDRTINLYDISGSKVLESRSSEINVDGFLPGIYLLEIQDENEIVVFSKKVIIN